MKHFVLGIDQGTTGTLVVLMNGDNQVVASAYRTHQQLYPQAGWVEHHPVEIWQNVRDLIQEVMAAANVQAADIAGIGIANQGESVMLWDKQTGNPLHHVLVWQDTRTASAIATLSANPEHEHAVRQRTGLKLDSYFSASKIHWLLTHAPEAQSLLSAGRLACGTLDTWLIWNMTVGRSFVTDVSTASRTLLFNIHTLQWDDWLLNLFQVPRDVLPDVRASTGDFGTVSHPDLPCRGVPIVASLVDQPAAMVGQGCLSAGQIKATYGTGCFINLNTGTDIVTSQQRLLTTLAWQRDGQTIYGLEGGVFTAAASVNWLREHLHFMEQADDIDVLCANMKHSGSVLWIPAQLGLGAPYWNRDMRGAWLGVDLATNRAQLIRAVLEGIAALVVQIIHAMLQDTTLTIDYLQVDGGLTRSKTMMQIQADLLGYPVAVLENPEATAMGICALANRAAGIWQSDDMLLKNLNKTHIYQPSISADEREAFLRRFDRAIKYLKAWHDDE